MQKQSENDFKLKFSSLNTQQNSEEIIWSSSGSSDYENRTNNVNLTINRKRKRVKTRKDRSKNISTLDITFEVPSEHEFPKTTFKKSPIFQSAKVSLRSDSTHSQKKFISVNLENSRSGSPILPSNSLNCYHKENQTHKSPILQNRNASPIVSPNVRKKLFPNNLNTQHTNKGIKRSISPVFNCSSINKQARYTNVRNKINQEIIETDRAICNKLSDPNKCMILDDVEIEDTQGDNNIGDHLKKTTNVSLIEKIKSFFDSNFSSETHSQQTISEYDTASKNSSKTSEEIEFTNSPMPIQNIIKIEKKLETDIDDFEHNHQTGKSKKVRYKKGGMAHRLSDLIKKQNANISLWQHERFLAANSNFVIPNDNFTPFYIQNVTFKYGCYLLDVIDLCDQKYVAIINSLNIHNNLLEQLTIFKLYRPYQTIDFNKVYKIIVNISKFECI